MAGNYDKHMLLHFKKHTEAWDMIIQFSRRAKCKRGIFPQIGEICPVRNAFLCDVIMINLHNISHYGWQL